MQNKRWTIAPIALLTFQLMSSTRALRLISPTPNTSVYSHGFFVSLGSVAELQSIGISEFCFSVSNTNTSSVILEACRPLSSIDFDKGKHLKVNSGPGAFEFNGWALDSQGKGYDEESMYIKGVQFVVDSRCSDAVGIHFESPCTNDYQLSPVLSPKCFHLWGQIRLTASPQQGVHSVESSKRVDFKQPMPVMREYLSVLSASRGMFGLPYDMQAFGHGDHMFLQFILARHSNFSQLVEFGTFIGATSLYLGMIARLRSTTLHTFDIADLRSESVKAAWLDNMEFHLADLEVPALDPIAAESVRNANFLFVDGGQKEVEALLYARFLPVGSGILLHDWSYDHTRDQSFLHLEQLGFEALYEDMAIHLNSCARFWFRVRQALPCQCPPGHFVKHVSRPDIYRCAQGLHALAVSSWDLCLEYGSACAVNPLALDNLHCLELHDAGF